MSDSVGKNILSGNYFDKYGSGNPIVIALMKGFFGAFGSAVRPLGVSSILEVGCGEGHLGNWIHLQFPSASYLGTDVDPDIIAQAAKEYPDLKFETVSIEHLADRKISTDLVVAAEVFEHLPKPAEAMVSLLMSDFRYLLISVPREPIWRVLNMIRGKYLAAGGNTPGHVNHWSKNTFIGFLSSFNGLRIVKISSPFPWTMVLCEKMR